MAKCNEKKVLGVIIEKKMHYRMYMNYAAKPVDFEAPNRSV